MGIELKGGDRLQARLDQLGKQFGSAKGVKAGFLEGATYPDGTPVATIAAIQDGGAPAVGIPPRPFMRNVIARNSPEWGALLLTQIRLAGGDVDKALGKMGLIMAGQIRESIINTNEPALKPATIRRKGFSKPLIDTSTMINAVDSEVVE